MGRGALMLALAVAALAPMAATPTPDFETGLPFPGWPESFEGRPLKPLPLADREAGFLRAFPGRAGRFTAGRREVVIRWVVEPSRRLHPSADCFQGLGYGIRPADSERDGQGRRWGAFLAIKEKRTLRVRELVVDAAGASWSDVPSWYWPALLGRSPGPWWVFTVAEEAQSTR